MSNKTTISIELFPPKSLAGIEKIDGLLGEFNTHQPEFYSITFGAGGCNSQQHSLRLIKKLIQQGVTVTPHLTCIGMNKPAMQTILEEYIRLGITQCVIVRGDQPQQLSVQQSEFSCAEELVRYIRQATGNHFTIHVAAYPEVHPESVNFSDDLFNLKRKINSGANTAITQYFYNPEAYYNYLDLCEKFQITIPIKPGIMPIYSYEKLKRFSAICQADIPQWLDKRLQTYAYDKLSLIAFGIDVVSKLCEDLLKYGAPGLHFYSLNQATLINQILENIKQSVVRCSA